MRARSEVHLRMVGNRMGRKENFSRKFMRVYPFDNPDYATTNTCHAKMRTNRYAVFKIL
jgi:hypothetical protein